jgi:tetratricopeptide (TPR) repeat protein
MTDEHSPEMNALTAHLDRGWDLLHLGDLAAARVSAEEILKLEPESPEGHTLLGAIAAAEGDPDEALDQFRQAMDADPEYLEAILYATELATHSLGDLDYALRLCDQAEELVDDGEGRQEVQLLRSEAHLAAGHLEDAEKALERVPGETWQVPAHCLRAGRIFVELGQGGRAVKLLESALDDAEMAADGHYYLGLALEMDGRPAEALEHLLETWEVDRDLPEAEWAYAQEEFEHVVQDVVHRLPATLAKQIEAVPVLVLDHPAAELIAEGFDPRGLVYFSGVPAPEPAAGGRRRRGDQGGPQLTCVFVYKRMVERASSAASDVPDELLAALEHEAEFFFTGRTGRGEN